MEDALLFPEISSYVNESAHPSPKISSPLNESADPLRKMRSELYRAAASGNEKYLKTLVKDFKGKHDVFQEFTPLGNSVLHIAVSRGHLPFSERLLVGVGPEGLEFVRARNSDGNSALHLAAFYGHHELVDKLIGVMKGDVEAVGIGSQKIGLLRLKNGEGNAALHEAAKGGNLEVVKTLLKNDESLAGVSNCQGETALFVASQSGDEDIVERLLPLTHIMKRKDGQTPLHSAVFYGHIGVVEKLLNHSPELAKQTDERGRTAMHMLALSSRSLYKTMDYKTFVYSIWRFNKPWRMIIRTGFEKPLRKITGLLLKDDICLCYKQDDKNRTPLHIAVELGKYELVGILLNYGRECTDVADENGRTPLHLAVENEGRISDASLVFSKLQSYRNMLSSLMSQRSLNHRDNCGRTPVQIAIENTKRDEGLYSSIVELLSAKGTLMTPEILEDEWRIEPASFLSRIKAESISVNAVLIATVSFAAAFTLPGGLDSQPGQKPKAVFIDALLFKLFLISDTLSFCTSIASAILVQYKGSGKREEGFLVGCSLMLLWSALVSLVVAFGAAVHLVISPSPLLAGIVWTVVCLAPSAIVMALGGSSNVHGEEKYMHWMLFLFILATPLVCVLMIPVTIYYIFWFADIFRDLGRWIIIFFRWFADILSDLRRWIIKLFRWCKAKIFKVRHQ